MKNRILALALVFSSFTLSLAGAITVPPMNGPVNDRAGVLSASEKENLFTYLEAVNAQTGVQIALLTIPSLDGADIESYSLAVVENWKLGQADKDNGVLLVVAVEDRELRIEVGYGLEGELTDAKSGLIIRNVIIPRFRENDYGRGISEGLRTIGGVVTGDVQIVENLRETETRSSRSSSNFSGILFFLFFLFFVLGGSRKRGRKGGWIAPFILGSMMSSGRSSGSSSSIFKSGGFGGGGFSGGGGGFGGGGASGKW